MAKDKRLTGDYDKDGEIEEVEATTTPPPGIAPHGVPAGLPPESYMTAQEAHVSEGGEYAPPPESEEDARVRHAKDAKDAEAAAKETEAKKAKKEK